MNPAARLNTIVDFFTSANPNESMLTAWQRYFGLEQSGSEHEALIATQAVLSEIRNAETKLKQIQAPEHLFRDSANILRSAFSPTQFGVPFSNHREAITRRATPLALQWASWTLSQFNENDISEESIKSLQESLAAQESLLKESTLPESLREMLERQVADLKLALALYKVSGTKPLVDAINRQYGEMRHSSVEIIEFVENGPPEAETVMQKAMKLLAEAAKVANQGSNIIKFGKEICELGAPGWHLVQQMLTSN